eukprot:2230791-Pyramimonas_sp.AAC.1
MGGEAHRGGVRRRRGGLLAAGPRACCCARLAHGAGGCHSSGLVSSQLLDLLPSMFMLTAACSIYYLLLL